ncbi:RsmB/NOP family class I SAM-dependent RNA methyltransferase [Calderihabitans maritimus]|uniref:SAM-dependent methyltransferase n=1 Tax=Calderihabitans maritimus TaxID=1246530 RepID=A0A1Z5HSV4_9FIRM|nr:RsmB/NOP family class I SAM-dependent RNA methyltransferase [Calderihabitans maritimus]GAW92613.1 SAM-dependent methyltransferase [Calderihabitans maritimus]
MRLPEKFLERMEQLLGEEYKAFIASYREPRHYGLRVNTLKISVEKFKRITPFSLEPVPWTEDGFYFNEEARPGKHPYYYAGLYYIQEPSAMAPAALLKVKPGERVLDLCAAPGGKSTQMAAAMAGEGLLVANDINFQRSRVLAKVLELFAVKNAVVINEQPERLAQRLPGYFDKVLVDATCSGEGMFRKDPAVIGKWGPSLIERCAGGQRAVLRAAARLLRPGGILVYSTCTFAPEENEGVIEKFLREHPEFCLLEIPKEYGFVSGNPEWVNGREELRKCVRLWPHRVKGEGHFIAMLKKESGEAENLPPSKMPGRSLPNKYFEMFREFEKDNLKVQLEGNFYLMGNHLYIAPQETGLFEQFKLLRAGWYLGSFKKNRFEPGQGLALGLKKEQVQRTLDLRGDSEEVIHYLKKETLSFRGQPGWTLVCVDGFPLGWGKQTGKFLKNYYPTAWRWVD